MENDIIFFCVNNWFSGQDYPDTSQFNEWMKDSNLVFSDDKFCKDNKLCTYYGAVDMSSNFTVSAPKKWVEENCPEIIGSKFQHFPEANEIVPKNEGLGNMPFREYCEKNFGAEYYETGWFGSSV